MFSLKSNTHGTNHTSRHMMCSACIYLSPNAHNVYYSPPSPFPGRTALSKTNNLVCTLALSYTAHHSTHICPRLHECVDDANIPLHGCKHDWRGLPMIPAVDLCSCLDQDIDAVGVVVHTRVVQGGRSSACTFIDIGLFFDQDL